mmetsp:Transcript_29692/g.79741  ORF Transcript_29692/g.79741 Transcript_29692/m.79741 type:complete len:253 (+) Transcript_29692:740-1498(+)
MRRPAVRSSYLASSRMTVAAACTTSSLGSLTSCTSVGCMVGGTRSPACLPNLHSWAIHRSACVRTTGSRLERSGARATAPPASCTARPSSSACLAMSARREAAMRWRGRYGSPRDRSAGRTAPASVAAVASSLSDVARDPITQSAAVFISGSYSSKDSMSVLMAPASSACVASTGSRTTWERRWAAPSLISFLTMLPASSWQMCGKSSPFPTASASLSDARDRRVRATRAENCTPVTRSWLNGATVRTSCPR